MFLRDEARGAVEPATEDDFALQFPAFLEEEKEGRLCGILGIHLISNDSEAGAIDHRLVAHHDLVHGFGVAFRRQANQDPVLHFVLCCFAHLLVLGSLVHS